jgi:hypothetical protein
MSLLDKIRDEVLETQKTQASFARWKLLLVASLGAAGLGIVPREPNGRGAALLSLLPLVCVYADSLFFNSGIRVLAIARYLRVNAKWNGPDPSGIVEADHRDWAAARDYERFFVNNRHHFDLEVVALQGVTLGVSTIVLILGVLNFFAKPLSIIVMPQSSPTDAVLLMISGILGVGLAKVLYSRHRRKAQKFDRDSVMKHPQSLARTLRRVRTRLVGRPKYRGALKSS